jgi:hypothetical protein
MLDTGSFLNEQFYLILLLRVITTSLPFEKGGERDMAPKTTAKGGVDNTPKKQKKERVILSRSIHCDASILSVLAQETIILANVMLNEIDEKDSCLVVQINDENNLHASLALPNSPVVQGLDAAKSLEAFQGWLRDGARNVKAGCQVLENSDVSLAFRHFTQGEAITITLGQWQEQRWNIEIQDSGFEEFASVFWMAGTGEGCATLTIAPNIFG